MELWYNADMRKLRLRENPEIDSFVQLKAERNGALLQIEDEGRVDSQFHLTLKHLAQIREWSAELTNEVFKKNRISSKKGSK